MRTRRFLAVLAVMLVWIGNTSAQTYPAKPVRVVVPWPPGGSNDIVGRVVAQKLSELMGQQFVVDNRGGASGIIGSEAVAKSPPDGYTFMIHSATHVANPHLYSKIAYDTLKARKVGGKLTSALTWTLGKKTITLTAAAPLAKVAKKK